MRLLGKALTFDDVLLVPAYSEVLPKDTSLQTRLTRTISLNLPLVSAAMDTVTESRLAISMAQEGGIGIIHKNLTAQEQATHVAKVKRHESGVLRDPVVITPDTTVLQVKQLSDELGISGFPVIDAGRVVGIVTGRDLRFETRLDVPVRDIMTQREKLITVREGTTSAEAKALLNKHKLERLLVVNDAFELKGLITVKDITKQTTFPNAARDEAGSLRVGGELDCGAAAHVGGHCRVTQDLRVVGDLSCDGGIKVGGHLQTDAAVQAARGVWVTGDVDCKGHLQAGWGVRAGGHIHAGGAIRAGESLWAGETIAAGEAYGVYAGLVVPLPDWPHSAQVCAREQPARLLSGCWTDGQGNTP